MPDVQTLINTFHVSDPATLLTILGSGGAVAVVLQILKHYKIGLKESKVAVVVLLTGLSFLATLADYVLQFSNMNPKLVVGQYWGDIIAAAVVIHRFSVSPMYYKLDAWRQAQKETKAAANAYRALNAPAQSATPVSPLDLANPKEFTLGL